MAEFLMPILGADMTAGTLVAWLKGPGDPVRRGDVIAEVETDKGLIAVEVYTGGVIDRLLVAPGATVPTGTPLAVIQEAAPGGGPALAGVPAPPTPAGRPLLEGPTPGVTARARPAPAGGPAVTRERPPVVTAPGPVGPVVAPGRIRVTPLARTVAARLGIDVGTIRGTGAGGAITKEDVERAAAERRGAPAGTEAPAPPTREAPTPADAAARMRQTIGAAMARSKREIPHYYVATTIDLHRAMTWLRAENERRPVTERLLAGVLLIKAVALALREVPELNAVWAGDRPVRKAAIHVGVAVSLRGGGLVAPAIHETDRLGLGELMQRFRDVVQRARAGGLRSSELSDPTITVTSLGEQGVDTVFGIVYPPQVAIVGFGRVAERPWVVEGAVVARPMVTATLSADHRVSDGHRGGLFLAAVDRLLQEPDRL